MAAISNRGHWIIRLALLLTALLVVASYFIYQDRQDRECKQWQARYEVLLEQTKGGGGAFDFVNTGPLAEARKERPADCEVPSR